MHQGLRAPSPQPSPASGRGSCPEWRWSLAPSFHLVGQCADVIMTVGASLLANGVCRWRRCWVQERPHPSPLPEGEGAVRSGREVQSHPDTPYPPRHSRGRGNPVAAGFASKLAPTKSKSTPALALAFGLPEKHPRTPERPFRRPSETGAQEVMRHGCRESPAGYRDVPSGRASVAGEFVRVARLHRARMLGQAFLVPFVAFDKRDSPEGAKQKTSEHAEAAQTRPNKKPLGSRIRRNDGVAGCCLTTKPLNHVGRITPQAPVAQGTDPDQ